MVDGLKQLFDVGPVDEMLDESLEIVGPAVSVVDVVRVLAHIDPENWRCSVHERTFAVRRLANLELAILHRKPRPARTKLSSAGRNKGLLELVVPAEIFVDLLCELGEG
jgi:hypothetical protein